MPVQKRKPLTAAMEPLDFQNAVLDGVVALEEKFEGHQTDIQKLLADPERLPKQLKEDLNALKKHANEFTKALAALQRINAQLRQEANASFGSPVERIKRCPQKRGLLNMFIRSVCTKDASLDKVVSMIGKNAEVNLGEYPAENIRALMGRHPETPIAKAIGEDSGEGSTLIIAQLYKEIYDTLAQYGQWATLGVRNVGTKVTNFPIKTARPVAAFLTSEASPIPDDTNYAGSTNTETVLPIAVLLNVSKQLLEDAEFDVTGLVMPDFEEAFNQRLDNACFNGNGAGAGLDGNFTGLFNGGTAVVAGAGAVTAQLTKYDDWAKLLTAVAPIVLKRNPRFWMHPFMLIRAMQVIISGIGCNVRYAAAHELGVDKVVQVKEHTMRNSIRDRYNLAGVAVDRFTALRAGILSKKQVSLATQQSGKYVIAKKGAKQVVKAGSVTVKAHSMHMHLAARHIFSRGIDARLDAYGKAISAAIVQQWGGN